MVGCNDSDRRCDFVFDLDDKMKLIEKLLKPKQPEDVLREKLFDARRQAIEHEAAFEHHQALAAMYKARIVRIRKELEQKEIVK